jgi:hypothetical protein
VFAKPLDGNGCDRVLGAYRQPDQAAPRRRHGRLPFLLLSLRGLPLDAPADERARKLRYLVSEGRFAEALGLLVVAQQSLYLWHRLRLMHIAVREPEHLAPANAEARRLLQQNEEADGELIKELYEVLSNYGGLRPLEVHRRLSRRRLQDDVAALREAFEMFARARNAQVSSWPEAQDPTLKEALGAVHAGRPPRWQSHEDPWRGCALFRWRLAGQGRRAFAR